ncbi:MAG: TauD/TfdA dioxygenase family protein [Gammaproteobacteria bacterium]
MKPKTCSLTPWFGAEVLGVDLAGDLSDDLLKHLRWLHHEHSVLLFRDQRLEPAAQARLAQRFGWPKVETRKQFNMVDYPEVSTIGNVTNEQGKSLAFFAKNGLNWHTDGTSACHVNAVTFLYAVEVPKHGGDTLYCSTAEACSTLSEDLKATARGISVLCSFHAHNDQIIETDPKSHIPLTAEERAALPPVWHRIVQTHPVTRREVLYLNQDPLEFKGIAYDEGLELVKALVAHATQADKVYRHRWRPGDLVMWDNHSTLHSTTDTEHYINDRRLMHRSFVYTLPTERPIQNLDRFNKLFLNSETCS